LRLAPREVSVLDARKVCTDIATKSWQRKWDEDKTERCTYEFIPVVGTKVLWPRKREIGVSYGRMLLHNTMLKNDSYRTDTAETPMCECGQDKESVLGLGRFGFFKFDSVFNLKYRFRFFRFRFSHITTVNAHTVGKMSQDLKLYKPLHRQLHACRSLLGPYVS